MRQPCTVLRLGWVFMSQLQYIDHLIMLPILTNVPMSVSTSEKPVEGVWELSLPSLEFPCDSKIISKDKAKEQ